MRQIGRSYRVVKSRKLRQITTGQSVVKTSRTSTEVFPPYSTALYDHDPGTIAEGLNRKTFLRPGRKYG